MAELTCDVVVVGAGVGGACAALAAAARGLRVVLVEAAEFPRHKVCGEFVSPEGVAVLERLGVAEAMRRAGARAVARARVVGPRGNGLTVALPAAGLALSRYRLDHLLWQCAQGAGVRCVDHCPVEHLAGDNESWAVHSGNTIVQARAVIAAPGRKSAWLEREATPPEPLQPVPRAQRGARYVGIKTHLRGAHLEPGIVELHCFPGGYCGVLRVEDDLADVCLLARYDVLRSHERDPAALWGWLLARLPALRRTCDGAPAVMPWLVTGNLLYGGLREDHSGVLRVGDAAGYIQPLSGDGMAMAARAGELAAGHIARGLHEGAPRAAVAAGYYAQCRGEFSGRLRWAGVLHALFTGPAPVATGALRLGAACPPLARLFAARTRGDARHEG